MPPIQECVLTNLFSERARGTQPSAIREICKLIDSPGMKSLAGGWPDPAVFPAREISDIVFQLLSTKADKILQYGTTEGLLDLRQEISAMAESEGMDCGPDQILITHGSAQGMDLACRTFINPGDIFLVGLPTYFGGTSTIASYGGRNIGIPVDENGLNVDVLAETLDTLKKQKQFVKGVYVIPNFQNPTGATLSLKRRKKLIALAGEYDLIIFEDDPYGELRFEGKQLPSLMSLSKNGRVIHMRSMSKTFAPGMRIAWVAGNTEAVRKMTISKQFVDCATNSMSQYILAEFIRKGLLKKEISKNRNHYKMKRDIMLNQLASHFPDDVRWNQPAGGFFIFVTLPEKINAMDLLSQSLKKKVAFVAGKPFFVDQTGDHTLRLSYSQASQEDIQTAIPILGELIRNQLKS